MGPGKVLLIPYFTVVSAGVALGQENLYGRIRPLEETAASGPQVGRNNSKWRSLQPKLLWPAISSCGATPASPAFLKTVLAWSVSPRSRETRIGS
ncbi:MAG: hypothetical protein ABI837_01570 [Acidobacteriota bacterium]